MNHFDLSILTWFNQYAQRWLLLDAGVRHLSTFYLLKGTPFVLVLAWLWLSKGDSRRRHREVVVATCVAMVCSILVARLMANNLPFRPRPIHGSDFHFVVPWTVSVGHLGGWSAFPSDHAVLFATLATGFWFVSPILGLAAHAYAAIVIGLPRIYLGLHHPTDLLAGAAIGIVLGTAANLDGVRQRIASWPLQMCEQRPTAFNLVAILVILQLATTFDDAQAVVRGAQKMTRAVWSRFVVRPTEAAVLSARPDTATDVETPSMCIEAGEACEKQCRIRFEALRGGGGTTIWPASR